MGSFRISRRELQRATLAHWVLNVVVVPQTPYDYPACMVEQVGGDAQRGGGGRERGGARQLAAADRAVLELHRVSLWCLQQRECVQLPKVR